MNEQRDWAQANAGKKVRVSCGNLDFHSSVGTIVGYSPEGRDAGNEICVEMDPFWSDKNIWVPGNGEYNTAEFFVSPKPKGFIRWNTLYLQLLDSPVSTATKCVCGSDKIGSPRHSSWCPKL